MRETAVVIGSDGQVLYWHAPLKRTMVAIPDTRALWDVLWQHREQLLGVAHTHPGIPAPSQEDLTTFAACEAGLGRRLKWWILTADRARCFAWKGPEKLTYIGTKAHFATWMAELRHRSASLGEQND
ncbi:MAG: hypothetical protein HN348_11780 [Proteobacteria bacterium]|jgi:proteasome lid subunit RPN8/RPN11|nr:hypothetical protein [Pseudomonadota bacterium]